MGDKKKRLKKIGITSLLMMPLLVGAAIWIVNWSQRKEDIRTIESIKIVSELNTISLEEGNSYTTDPIVVKVYDDLKQEVEVENKPTLALFDESLKTVEHSWITINENNQIVIDENAKKGNYTFYLKASYTEGNKTIESEYKPLSVDVTISTKVDRITVEGFEYFEMTLLSTKEYFYDLKAWHGENEIPFPLDRKVKCEFWGEDYYGQGKTPPYFLSEVEGNQIHLKIISNGIYGEDSVYTFNAKVYFEDDESICWTASNRLRIYDGTVIN